MKPHVLVVDDSLIVRMDLRGALIAAGFEVTACETKRAAEELLDRQSFAALVLDVMLPDGDGVEILRRVRANAQHSNTPVIMLSAEAEIRDRVRGLRMGADEYVGKPYNIAYFIGRVRELCRSGRSNALDATPMGSSRILVVDDSPTFLQYIAQLLREDGHDVVLAGSGPEALEMLAAQTIDCIVLDLHMPNVDGLETLRQIRQTPGRESTPIMMLTGSQALTVEREARDAGADAFLRKSATLDVIRSQVRKVLRGRRTSPMPLDAASGLGSSSTRKASPQDAMRSPVPSSQRSPSSNPGGYFSAANRQQPRDLNPLFVEAASAMGINSMLARDTLAKVLGRMSIDPQRMDYADLARTLPALRDALQMFFSPDEVVPRMEALANIAMRPRSKAK